MMVVLMNVHVTTHLKANTVVTISKFSGYGINSIDLVYSQTCLTQPIKIVKRGLKARSKVLLSAHFVILLTCMKQLPVLKSFSLLLSSSFI